MKRCQKCGGQVLDGSCLQCGYDRSRLDCLVTSTASDRFVGEQDVADSVQTRSTYRTKERVSGSERLLIEIFGDVGSPNVIKTLPPSIYRDALRKYHELDVNFETKYEAKALRRVREIVQWLENTPTSVAEYVTGFFEGDGHLGERTIDASQVVSEPLDFIKTNVLGVRVCQSKKRSVWHAHCSRREYYQLLLVVFADHVVSETFLGTLNVLLKTRSMLLAAKHAPTIDWLAGFFDAEGSVPKHSYSLVVGQKERCVLESIQCVFGGRVSVQKERGYPDIFSWSVCRETGSVELANQLWQRTHHPRKREQLESLLTRVYIAEHRL